MLLPIRLTDEEHRDLKIFAAKKGCSMKSLVIEGLKLVMAEAKKEGQ